MGSLPNLSDLGREDHVIATGKMGSVMGGHVQHGPNLLTYEEKNRILHRHSGYGKNAKFKTAKETSNIIYDDFMLEVSCVPYSLASLCISKCTALLHESCYVTS